MPSKAIKQPKPQETARARYLYAHYHITLHDYDLLVKRQGGKCLICRTAATKSRLLVVDHNHQTGIVRGLLCSECNTAIGLLADNPALLRRAAEYLDMMGDYAGTPESRPSEQQPPQAPQMDTANVA